MTVNSLGFPLLTLLVFLPGAGGILLMLLSDRSPDGDSVGRAPGTQGQAPSEGATRWTSPKIAAVLVALAAFGISLYLLVHFTTRAPVIFCPLRGCSPLIYWTRQFSEHGTWFPSLGVSYYLAVDGLNVWLVMLTTSVMTLAIFASCFMINRRIKAFLMLMLLAETGMLGVFLSWNLFLFYIFWEVMLVPAYFLVGMWGESKRVYATTKFVIYTIFGSFIMLVAIFYLYATTPHHNLDVPYLIQHPPPTAAQPWLFLAFLLAFAIKAGLFPFHSWAPDTYVEAPVPATVLIASVMAKTATFGIIRFALPIFPHAANQFSGFLSILAVIGILYGATMALVQIDAKRVLAYASISHMNIILLGIFALDQQGIDGSILQMVNHAVIMAGLFFMVAMIYARSGTRRLDEMNGLAKAFPVMAAFALLLFLAAMDLPGLGSFSGEFTILIGVFVRNAWFATVAALVSIAAAWYMVRWFQGIFHGPVGYQVAVLEGDGIPPEAGSSVYEFPVRRGRITRDLRMAECAVLLPIAAVIVWLGVIPKSFTDRTAPTVRELTALVSRAGSPRGGASPASNATNPVTAADVRAQRIRTNPKPVGPKGSR